MNSDVMELLKFIINLSRNNSIQKMNRNNFTFMMNYFIDFRILHQRNKLILITIGASFGT